MIKDSFKDSSENRRDDFKKIDKVYELEEDVLKIALRKEGDPNQFVESEED